MKDGDEDEMDEDLVKISLKECHEDSA